jgi:hypothetical protein
VTDGGPTPLAMGRVHVLIQRRHEHLLRPRASQRLDMVPHDLTSVIRRLHIPPQRPDVGDDGSRLARAGAQEP